MPAEEQPKSARKWFMCAFDERGDVCDFVNEHNLGPDDFQVTAVYVPEGQITSQAGERFFVYHLSEEVLRHSLPDEDGDEDDEDEND
ncbi:MAG: hypothetical protein Q7S66_02260 [bacterium]|nr:hypothetical protein [bacterium]